MTSEEKVKRVYPEAVLRKAGPARGGQSWYTVRSGSDSDAETLGLAVHFPRSAWADAARRIKEERA